MSLVRGALQLGLPVAKKTAPFYSAVDEALAAIKRPKGTGAEFYTELTKQAGVKKAELADRKLEQAFKAKGKMTKEEAQQVLKDNPPPKLQEKTFTEPMDDYERDEALRDNMERFGYESWEDVPPRIMRKWEEELDENVEKYGDYRTAGGKNYREIILKLPASRPNPNNYRDPAQYDADMRSFNASGKADYQSTHWKEDPNVLAHMRVQDRKGPNGEKILHVEEIQSDWHQEGRKKGYGPKLEEQYRAYYTTPDGQQVDIGFGKTPEQVEQMTKAAGWDTMPIKIETEKTVRKIGEGVPDAPFKKNWHELAMKRLLNYAADQGYDSIAITPGAEQAKRFNLRNQIEQIKYIQNQDGTYDLAVRPKGQTRDTMFIGDKSLSGLPADELESVVGQEVSQKILSGEGPQGGDKYRSLTGVALEFGGEGMKGFYDQILPSYLNTFGKQYGVKVDPLPVDVGGFKVNRDNYPLPYRLESTTSPDIISRFATPEEAWAEAQRRGSLAVHNFPITPEMRESIKQKGLPLYQQVGIPTAGAGAASQMPEQEEPQYGPGGAISKMALKAAPAPRAPMIIKPSTLTELKKIVQQEKGDYGSRRLERAADEVPNLERMYNDRALKDVFTGDNARALMTMNPADFEEYAARLSPRNISVPGFNGDKQRQSTEDYVKYLTSLDRFDDVPFLLINKEEQGLPLMPFISGHEGRHRNRSLVKRGEQTGLVQLLPRAELREPFPRRSQQEYIDAMRQELEMTGNKVKPESYFDDSLPKNLFIERPPIDLPDIYAKGGAVKPKVKDSKSGKVRMTTNRDTMFMELSNKKLKRK
jgi:hypothetical protein